jgi:glycosyltransferase 2 family protein
VGLQSLMVLYYYVVAHALRIPLSLSACFLMVPLCTLIQTIPISFNGWGIRESVFAVYFTQIGLPRESALAFSLVGAGLIVLLSLSGAFVWAARGDPEPEAGPT